MSTLFSNRFEPDAQNQELIRYITKFIGAQYPIVGKVNTLELKNVEVDLNKVNHYDIPAQKEEKLKGGTWAYPVYAHLVLRDNKTGRIIDESKKMKILSLPSLTNRYSMIIDGSEYQTINQLRLKSGIYTREKENGELESWFDLEKGYNFKMIFDPDTKLFYLVLANRKFKVYTLLRALGFPDSEMKKAWGLEIFDANQRAGLDRETKEIPELVAKLIRNPPKDYENSLAALVKYLEATKVSGETTKLTLGESFEKVNADTLFATSKKILGVLRGEQNPDERDSLVFKNLLTPTDLLEAYLEKQEKSIVGGLKSRTDSKTSVRDIISAETYTKPLKKFYTTGDLSSTPEQTNPISILSEWRKTTIMGTGGIQSSHAITMGARDVHPSHLGFLDPIATPESGKIGVTLPLPIDVEKRGVDIEKKFIFKDGTKKYLSPLEASQIVVGYPDQWDMVDGLPKAKSPRVRAMKNGKVMTIDAKEVQAWIDKPWALFSWSTNLIPFMAHNDATRASFGSKMTAQAIPLVSPESPLVESKITGAVEKDITFEKAIGRYLSPMVPSTMKEAEVVKVTPDYIHLQPVGTKEVVKIGLFNDFPLNRETYLSSTPRVSVGDKVKANEMLAFTNFQDKNDGSLAIGLNVNVAYMPWKGLNYEDSAVITESLARRFTSTKIMPEVIHTHKEGFLNLNKFRINFPQYIDDNKAKNYGEDGVIKVGSMVDPGDILVAYLEPKDMTDEERILRSMNKSMYVPYVNRSLTWSGHERGQVVYVNYLTGGKISVHIKVNSPMVVGDKIAGRHGNKSLTINHLALTQGGWKYIKDVKPDIDLVATLNSETHEFEWQAPSEVHEYAYDGKAYHVGGGDQIYLTTTPDHRHYAKLRDGRRNTPEYTNFQIFNPEEQFGKRKKFCRWAKWSGKLEIDSELPINIKNKELDFFKWAGYFISEGCIGGNNICISQKENTQESKEIQDLITNIFGYCSLSTRKDNRVTNHYVSRKECGASYFKELFGHCAENKKIPHWMKEAPVEYLQALLYGLIKGDGSEECNRIRYFTVSQTLAHDVAEIGIKCGYAVNITTREQPLCEINDVQVQSSQLLYIVSLNSKQGLEPLVNGDNNAKEEWIDYKGNMVCLTVPNGIFLTTSDEMFCPVWTGNSIVSRIIPDEEAPHKPDGTRIDLILSPNGVPGRMNAGQILETAAGKVANATGKKFLVENFSGENMIGKIKSELAANGLSVNEVLLDGQDGKPFLNPVFAGNQYIMKLMHTVEHKAKARSYGTYSVEEQPSTGDEGGQRVDALTTFALLAHGARENMSEFAALKSQRNDEIWAAIQSGRPIPPPQANFAFEKLLVQLKGAGINVNRQGDTMLLEPVTDEQITKLSNGELKDAGHMLIGKNLAAIPGGLFDKNITGGLKGKKWSHIELAEKMPNPLFEKPMMLLLGLTKPQFDKVLAEQHILPNGMTGVSGLFEAVKGIDIDKEINKSREQLVRVNRADVNRVNLRIRYLQALKKLDMRPEQAYFLTKFPIMPPSFRPIFALPSGDLNYAPVNTSYRNLALTNKNLLDYKKSGLESTFGAAGRVELYKEMSNTIGLTKDMTPGRAEKEEGILISIAGKSSPKYGYAHNKLWSKRQDLSARSTITLDPQLGLDEIGLPEHLYKKIFIPFAVQRMVHLGYNPIEARQMIKDDNPIAQQAFIDVMRERPVLMNRAPSLHKHSIQAHIARPTSGSSIKLNPLIVKGYNADFDGDFVIGIILVYIKSNTLKLWYNNSEQEQTWFAIRKVPKIMASRFNVDLAALSEGDLYIFNLEDFPYDKNDLIGSKNNIDFYRVKPGIKVFAYDEVEKKVVLAPVAGWSVHKDREVWTVSLHNKHQLITDDDERAVYGVLPGTIELTRKRPKESMGMLVPYAKKLENIMPEQTIDSLEGFGKLQPKIDLSKETGYILGTLIGDGWVDEDISVILSGIEKSVTSQYSNFVTTHIFKEAPHIGHQVGGFTSYGRSEKWSIASTDFAKWVLPLIGKGAENKHLPPMWYNTSREFKLGLLSGLLDTDGSICITRGKEKPQLQANFSSVSLRLLQELQQMLRALGVYSRISFSKITDAKNPYWILAISAIDLIKLKDELIIAHKENIKALNSAPPDETSAAYVKTDLIPISKDIATALMSKIGLKSNRTLYMIVSNGKRNGYISRTSAHRAYELRGDYTPPKAWIDILNNEDVSWAYVTGFENTGKVEIGYDLTVPGFETFMNVDGIVLSNTMSVQVPVSEKAVEEAYTMLPSRNVWTAGSKSNLPAGAFSKDYQLGLWHLTRELETTNYSVRNLTDAYKLYETGKIKLNSVLTIGSKRTTLGRYMVTKLLPSNLQEEYDTTIDKKKLQTLLNTIARDYPNRFGEIIDALKDLAIQFGHSYGATISLDDLDIDRSWRDKVIKHFEEVERPEWDDTKKATHWLKAQQIIEQAQNEYVKKTGKSRGLFDMLDSGAEGKQDSVRQLITMPGVKVDVYGKAMPEPIKKSYAEGLDQGSYWMSLYGARKGMVDRAINTEESGAINKSLLGVTKNLLITEVDCGTHDGVDIELSDMQNLFDRFLPKDISGVGKRNDDIDNTIIQKAKAKGLRTLTVRSPLTCESVNGICQYCYGLSETGNLEPLGTNVGVKSGQAVTERSTQLTLKSFHSGGSAAAEQDVLAGFPRMEQILKVPEIVAGKATLAATRGTVDLIEKSAIGGLNVYIGGVKHHIPHGRQLLVRKGAKVMEGDQISSGAIKPQELAGYKGYQAARLQMVSDLEGVFKKEGLGKKTIETVIRGVANQATIEYAPKDSDYLRGDTVTLSKVLAENKKREARGQELIQYEPYFKSIDTLALDNPDWLSKLTVNRIRETLREGAALGAASNLHGTDPMPSYLYGTEFNKDVDPSKGRFY